MKQRCGKLVGSFVSRTFRTLQWSSTYEKAASGTWGGGVRVDGGKHTKTVNG